MRLWASRMSTMADPGAVAVPLRKYQQPLLSRQRWSALVQIHAVKEKYLLAIQVKRVKYLVKIHHGSPLDNGHFVV